MRLVKTSVFFLLLIGLSAPIYSQHQHKLDSLEELIRIKSGIDRYDPLTDLAIEYSGNEDYNEAIQFLKEAHTIAYRYGDTLKIIQSGRLMGQVFNRLYNHAEAKKILLAVLSLAERTHGSEREIAQISNNLALIYTFQAAYDKALYYNFQTLEHWKTLGDKFYTSISLHNIGLVYYKLSNYDKAMVYYNKALELKKELKSEYDLDKLLINLCLCYVNKKEFNMAKKYLDDTFLACNDNCSSQIEIEGYYAKGEIAYAINKLKEAEMAQLKSYKLSCENNHERFQLESIESLAKIYIKQGEFSLAKKYLNKALEIGLAVPFNDIQIHIYEQFFNLYTKTNDYKNAARYQAKYILLRDSIYGEELTQNLMVVQAEYEQHENKAKIESQNKVLALKEEIIKRQNILTIVAGVAIILLTSLIFVLYRNNHQKKKINEILEQNVQERTRELESSYALIQKAYSDQNNFIEKAAQDIRSPLSTMKGLCSLGLKEVSESEAQQYLIQLNDTTDQLVLIINNLTANSRE